MQEIDHTANPFPGLRPFESSETHLFFGRDGQSEELLRRLRRTRFLAVVGTSGSGKSSLVRAGLLPALQGGLMASAGSDWRIAILRPGGDPIGNLARALVSPAVLGSSDEKGTDMQAVIAETTLRRSSLGLVELVSRARTKVDEGGHAVFPDYENLLIVVDQFEELFRFKQLIEEQNSKEDAAVFVKLLLEAAGSKDEKKIYVVLTMRSDFLGDCSQFFELPEAINNGQYLIPRMTRDERRQAISGPVAVGQGAISEPLVNQLLNDVGDNPDQLPILQHALMRTWDHWQHHRNGEAIDIPDYNAIGGMAEALSRHADEAYAELDDQQKVIAEKLFKGLTEKGTDNREIRRPMEVGEICELTGADEAAVIVVIEVFRREGRSFLMPPPTDALTGAPVHLNRESLIDISHESLIRNWDRLKTWVHEESRSARIYRRLADTAVLHKEGGAALLRDPELGVALTWRKDSNPNQVWAKRYHPEFPLAVSFLDQSVTARDADVAAEEARRTEEIKRTRLTALLFAVAFLSSLALGVYAYKAKIAAQTEAKKSAHLLYTADIYFAAQEYENNNLTHGLELLEAHFPNSVRGETPGFEWYYLWRLYHQERATLSGPTGPLFSVAFSPDGRTVASGSDDGTVKLWDIITRQQLATLKGHTEAVYSVGFSRDGRTLASGGFDGTVKLWDTTTHQELATLNRYMGYVTAVVFSPDGRALATAHTGGGVTLWATASHRELATLASTNSISSLAFSGDGSRLAAVSEDGQVQLWDTTSHQQLATLMGNTGVLSITFSPDGGKLATGGFDGTVQLWDVTLRQELATLKHNGVVRSVAFSPDGRTLATGSDDGVVKLWDTSSDQEPAALKGHKDAVLAVAFSSDGSTLASASRDGSLKLWDSPSHQELAPRLTGVVQSVAFSPDGRTFVTVGNEGMVALWDVTSRQELAPLKGHKGVVHSAAFSPDGRTLATGGEDLVVKLWDTTSHEELATLDANTGIVYSVAFSPDGKMLASGGADGIVTLWDTISHRELARLTGHKGVVRSVAFAPDGRTLATASDDKIVKLWDRNSHKEIATLNGHTGTVLSVAFAPDGRTLATGNGDGTVKLWDTTSHQELATLKGHTSWVSAVAFSPDGKTFASGSADTTVKLWDVTSHQELVTLKGQTKPRTALAFSPDGRTLITCGAEGVTFWRGATDAEVAAQRK